MAAGSGTDRYGQLVSFVETPRGHVVRNARGEPVAHLRGEVDNVPGGVDALTAAANRVGDGARQRALAGLPPRNLHVSKSKGLDGSHVWAIHMDGEVPVRLAEVPRRSGSRNISMEAYAIRSLFMAVAEDAAETVALQRSSPHAGGHPGMGGVAGLHQVAIRITSLIHDAVREPGGTSYAITSCHDGEALGRVEGRHASAAQGIDAVLAGLMLVATAGPGSRSREFEIRTGRLPHTGPTWDVVMPHIGVPVLSVPRDPSDRSPTEAVEALRTLVQAAENHRARTHGDDADLDIAEAQVPTM